MQVEAKIGVKKIMQCPTVKDKVKKELQMAGILQLQLCSIAVPLECSTREFLRCFAETLLNVALKQCIIRINRQSKTRLKLGQTDGLKSCGAKNYLEISIKTPVVDFRFK